MRQIILLLISLLTVGGCGGEIYRTVKLEPPGDGTGPGTSVVTDARQRLISNVVPGKASRPGQVDPLRIVCVEPSPDVAVAVANSMGASAGIAGKGSFAISGAAAEGLAQIAERTTAIQAVLRQGYQACIDFMNGAINGTTYSLRQSRLDDLLVTLVLAEDAAGAFGRKGAFIGTDASSSARATASFLPEINKSLDQANNDLATKQEAVATAQKERDDAQAALDANDETKDPEKEKQLDAALQAKEANLRAKIAERDLALSKVTGLTEAATSAAAGVTQIAGQGGIDAQPDPAIAREIGEMQEAFVNKDVEQAYLSTCLIELGQWKLRDPEDHALRQLMLDEAAEARKTTQDYFYATQLGQTTWLTQHCERNFSSYLMRAQENRYNLNVMKLEIEAQRVKLEQLKAEKASLAIGDGVRLSYERNAALDAKRKFNAAREKIKGVGLAQAPGVSEEDKAIVEKLIERQTEVISAADALAASSESLFKDPIEADVTNLNKEFDELSADIKREGTEAEREDWRKRYDIQQQRAGYYAGLYRDFVEQAQSMQAQIEMLLRKIASLSKQS